MVMGASLASRREGETPLILQLHPREAGLHPSPVVGGAGGMSGCHITSQGISFLESSLRGVSWWEGEKSL